MKKPWLFLLALLLLAAPAVQAQFIYTTNQGAITITGYTGSSGTVVIPTNINGLPVTSIGNGAFLDCYILASLVIADSVTNVGSSAFDGCDSLTTVSLGNGVTSIGTQAFFYCGELTCVAIPNSVTNIGVSAFSYCGSLTGATIGNGLAGIGSYAFADCSALRGVYFQGNAPTPGTGVFGSDNNVTVYYLTGTTGWNTNFGSFPTVASNGITFTANQTVGYAPLTVSFTSPGTDTTNNAITSWNWSFGDGSSSSAQNPSNTFIYGGTYYPTLTATNSLGAAVAGFGPAPITVRWPFTYTTNNGTITITGHTGPPGAVIIPSTINGLPVTSIANSAFYEGNVTSVTITNGVTNIGTGAFDSCAGLTNVIIGDSLMSIGLDAFYGCTSLKSVTIAYGVTTIGSDAFYGCTNIASVTVPDSVTNIGSGAFENCSHLTNIALGNGVTTVGSSAFQGCTRLGSVTIPNSVTSIGNAAFENCTNLGNLVIPSAVSSVGSSAFEGCSGMTNLTIPSGVSSLGIDAFEGCSELINVTIPNSITSIGQNAFCDCYSLRAVYFQGNAPSTGSASFSDDTKATAYYLAGTTGWGAKYGGIPTVEWNGVVFTASCTNGLQALTVNFTSAGTDGAGNPITSWNWTFGDGGTSAAQNPSYIYTSAGTFYVSLLATNNLGATIYGVGPGAIKVAWPFNYTTNNGAISITGYSGTNGSAMIPGTINGLPVTTIANNAFYNCTSLKSVTIAYGVTTIGNYAFYGCTGLLSVTIPNSVTSIGANAFNVYPMFLMGPFVPSLTNINIPNSLTNLGMYAFEGCGMSNVIVPPGLASIPEGAFALCTFLTSLAMSTNVTSIGDSAFDGCSSLTNLTISDSVTNIGQMAFAFCTALTNVTIGNGVITIGDSAFQYCFALTGITIPSNVTSIGEGAFDACASLAAINVDPNNGAYMSLDGVVFNKNQTMLVQYPLGNGATFYSIPNGVTNIGDGAFNGCGKLTNVFIPSSVISMGDGPFTYCGGLTAINVDANNPAYMSVGGVLFNISQSVLVEFPDGSGAGSYSIPNGVTNIANDAFEDCGNLTNVTIPNGAVSIGNNAFYQCAKLAGMAIPNSVTSIGTYAFFYCSRLASVSLGTGVTDLGESAFESCSSLTNVIIPDSVTSIGESMFYDCTKLASVTIPMGITSIGESAFTGCGSLGSVTIPSSVTNIGSFGFLICSSLTSVYFLGNAPSADSTVFAGENATAYYLAGTTGWSAFASGADVSTVAINGNTYAATPTNGAAPLTVNFTSAGVDSGGNNISSWKWSYGDGASGAVQNPTHNYTAPGTYYVSLFATNNLGATVLGVGPQVITVSVPPLCIGGLSCCGANLTLNASNGISGATYYVLMSTDLTLPVSQWTPVATNVLSASGNFTITVTNTVGQNVPQQFYMLQSP